MPTITVSEHFNAAPNTAFQVITDFKNADKFIEGIVKVEILSEVEAGVGLCVRETRIMMGREATEEMEVIAYDPPNGFSVSAFSHGTEYLSTYELTPADGGTNATMIFKATPKTFMAKVLAALFSRMIGQVADMLQKDLREAAIEAERRETAA